MRCRWFPPWLGLLLVLVSLSGDLQLADWGGSLDLWCLVGSARPGCLMQCVLVREVPFDPEGAGRPAGLPPGYRAPSAWLAHSGGGIRSRLGQDGGGRFAFPFAVNIFPCS